MTDKKVIHIWDHSRARTDDPSTTIRRLILRRKFSPGERVTQDGHHGTVVEVSLGYEVRVLWDNRTPRDRWHDVLDVHRLVQHS